MRIGGPDRTINGSSATFPMPLLIREFPRQWFSGVSPDPLADSDSRS